MANHYVRAGASGTGTGADWDNAYTSLPPSLTRGDTYYFADGTYSGYEFDDNESGTLVITLQKATEADHGTSVGWSAAYAGGTAAFTGILDINASYITIDGVTGGGIENDYVGVFGFSVTEVRDSVPCVRFSHGNPGRSDITVKHIHTIGKGSAATSGGSASNDAFSAQDPSPYGQNTNILIANYRVTGAGRCPFFFRSFQGIVENGWVESYNGSTAVHSEVASIRGGRIGDTTFRYNLFTYQISTGGLMWDNQGDPSANLWVYGNVWYKPDGVAWTTGNGSLGGWTSSNGVEFHNCKGYNNTFINCPNPITTNPVTYSSNELYNNLFYNCATPRYNKFSADYNHVIDSGTPDGQGANDTLGTGDPFVNFTAWLFSLTGPTTAGATLASPYDLDPNGDTRGGDGTWDRGAYEYGGAAPVPKILYVRAGAIGTGNGSDWTNAFTDIPTTQLRGYTYWIADGTYGDVTLNAAMSATTQIYINKATAASHGTDDGWNAAYGDGQAVIGDVTITTSYWTITGSVRNDSDWTSASDYGFQIGDATSYAQIVASNGSTAVEHISLSYVYVPGYSPALPGTTESIRGFSAYLAVGTYASGIVISRCLFDAGNQCLYMTGTDNAMIEYCAIKDNKTNAQNPGAMISAFDSATNLQVRHNQLYDPMGLAAVAIADTASLGRTDNLRCYGNLVIGGDYSDGFVGYAGASSGSSLCEVHQNTIVGNAGANSGIVFTDGNTNWAFNNIFMDYTAANFSAVTHNYNTFDGAGEAGGEANGSVATTAIFTSYAGGDYTLRTAAPAYQSLNSNNTPYNVDPLGNTRGADGVWDAGAYELFDTGSAPFTLVSVNDANVYDGKTLVIECENAGAVAGLVFYEGIQQSPANVTSWTDFEIVVTDFDVGGLTVDGSSYSLQCYRPL